MGLVTSAKVNWCTTRRPLNWWLSERVPNVEIEVPLAARRRQEGVEESSAGEAG